MPNPRNLRQNKPMLFSPSVIRSVVDEDINTGALLRQDYASLSSSSMDLSSSFRYNLMGDGLRSTQQLNIDWSQFENHTFFNSAHVKTNVAFRKIFDQFPFDGSRSEFESFMDNLTGFEKYVYDQFPKNKGYLCLSASTVPGATGSVVVVKDVAGVAYPGVSRDLTGVSKLNPELGSMTIEFWLFPSDNNNDEAPVLSKYQNGHGFNISYDPGTSQLYCTINSGSYSLFSSASVGSLAWYHVAYVWDRSPSRHQLLTYVNSKLVHTSDQVELGRLNFDSADFLIGSSSIAYNYTFSGALDELRIWHGIRSQEDRDQYMRKNVFAQPDLKLYFKFNEASGSQSPIVLDHSGNSLHGQLNGFATTNHIRDVVVTGAWADGNPLPMTYEQAANNPVMFPLHPDVENLNDTLLDNAEEFDRVNPNRIDRLIPKHYLLQGQDQDGLKDEEGTIVDALAASGTTPDTAKLGDTQVILLLLYTWAKFFDEMKLYLQAFSTLAHLDYDSTDTIPDAFLHLFAEKFGIQLPPLFTGSSIEQFINAENLDNDISTASYSLQYIQNQIWRRILLNLQDILKSKGTLHSVKSFIRSVGIEPDNNFRIREFGGPTVKALANVRETRSEVSSLIEFSGTNGRIVSAPLSGSRLQSEVGYPYIAAGSSYVNGISNNSADGLYTSGSWTFEGVYRFPSTSSLTTNSQSLVRIFTTGSSPPSPGQLLLANLIAYSDTSTIRLYMMPNSSSLPLALDVSGANIFDGNPWYISFGRFRGDQIGSNVSSSYFLRVAKQELGEITSQVSASAYYNDNVSNPTKNFFTNKVAAWNASGSYLTIGSQSLSTGSANVITPNVKYTPTGFNGRVGHLRFWSRGLSETEWREHARNFKSLGVDDASANFNFVSKVTGSFEKLRMDASSDQPITASNASGILQIFDFSQNQLHWSGTFNATSSVIVPQRFQYSLLSPKFDVGSTTDKVRVRSFQTYENVLSSSYAQVAPLYAIEPSERPQDNTRFTIDFSVVDALDQDIINIFATLDILDNVIGDPALMFSPDYPGLETLRNIYFNRLSGQMYLKNFFEFYKWFDTNIGVFISQLIPRKTKFLGTNFVIESHMLERPKMEYQSADMYLGDSFRHALKDTILFQQIVASLKRF